MFSYLTRSEDISEARLHLERAGLGCFGREWLTENIWRLLFRLIAHSWPERIDIGKSWDIQQVIGIIKKGWVGKSAKILDAGCWNSEILQTLYRAGFRNLWGCDLNPLVHWQRRFWKTRYSIQDITATNYPNRIFEMVTCLSVIEHGVDIEQFFVEMSRIIASGGYLLLTFDYYPESIDTEGITAFGLPWHIFDNHDVGQMLKAAQALGFFPIDRVRLPEKIPSPVSWHGRSYTVGFLGLKKADN
ncbi:MAG: methyltransferase domain-containing protein [bacterium]